MPGEQEHPAQFPPNSAATSSAPNNRPQPVTPDVTAGDVAVDGLLWGLGAGVAMGLYLIVLSLANGEPAGAAFRSLGLPGAAAFLTSVLGHLAVAGVYGAIWALAYRWVLSRFPLPAWLWGLLYGAVLFGVAWLVAIPAGLGGAQLAHMLAAHLLYGAVLGLFTRRQGSGRAG
jgi:hypothetical protein